MQTFTALLLVIVTYFNTVFTGLPALLKYLTDKDRNHAWMITEAQIVTVDNYQDVYADYASEPTKYADRTEEYQALLDENLNVARQWRTQPIRGELNFYKACSPNGIWDYKQPNLHPAWTEKNGCFSAYHVDMNCEILGNLNYGLTGAAVGFPPTILYTMGGYLAIKNGQGKWENYYYYFDLSDDSSWITLGIMLYSLVDPNYTEDVAAMQVALSILDPRIVCAAYLMYMNMQNTPEEVSAAREHLDEINVEVNKIVANSYDEIMAAKSAT